ncbi:MAG: CopG family transcriptional regulator [Candidatus Omnitrophica bacterium CG11_big_fil_rev_8_21_14_0_20_45_26]|uniref:CopG family transcriptional regulator n=1 Tax=Candidatus Abzuiibacterium crystallinum TaxID=1974748 RepID=A0A2H0LSH9_9BACT|nr:MAG: CopG family transcriptional regulator [Candidatus Omnitrophica bacterium CG11_big_fil_rev_8_21_14_0_20_45_26]PIW64170.1 MAG: CopG family transcriptional regulator [Candidatus Omnitrophica bacterium CG12_big_fil_rev_8_21_14_0_65_45_16]
MKRNRKIDEDVPIGKLTVIPDFLPPPEELVFPEETEKITIALTRSTLIFFKQQSKKRHVKYQRMIREVLDRYAQCYHRKK